MGVRYRPKSFKWLPQDMYFNITSPHNDLQIDKLAYLKYLDRKIEESYYEASTKEP